MGRWTPWGKSDSSEKLATGVMRYGTPSHGGYHLSGSANEKVHASWRSDDGWYEEDCEWAIVALTFPELFEGHVEAARKTAKNWSPDGYTATTGETVALEESTVLRERAFYAANEKNFVVVSASGDWKEGVPKGFVECRARLGGHWGVPGSEERTFLVPADEYGTSGGPYGFVIDPSKHVAVTASAA